MRKLVIALMVMALGVGFATISYAGIAGTAHDFSSEIWNPGGEICQVCHTPHKADITVTDAPLWNHEVTAATFTLYSSGTLDATLVQPDGPSKLCLSCHDGTVALENFGGATGGGSYVSGVDVIGTDIRDDHPVSFTYNSALATADGELSDPSTTASGLGDTSDADMFFSSKVECASCHDAHGTGINYFLRKSNAASALCLTCHNK